MKNLLFILMISTSISAVNPAFAMEADEQHDSHNPTYLRWQDRPQELKDAIDAAYKNCAAQTELSWSWRNGRDYYTIAQVDETQLAHHLIISNPTQKDFYFLDIGAGMFQWGDCLAENLNAFSDIPNDVKINIIGLGGEPFNGNAHTIKGKCHLYKIDQFKIEEIENEFKSQKIKDIFQHNNLDFTNKFDGVWTHWCLRHLADPVGTIEQTYKLLKPNTGLFFGGNFSYGLKGQSKDDLYGDQSNQNITRLLLDMKVPFLIQSYEPCCAINLFVIKKISNALKFPLKYYDILSMGEMSQNDSQVATIFEHIGPVPEEIGKEIYSNPNTDTLYGDKNLFDYFKNNKLFYQNDSRKHKFLNEK